MILFDKLWQTMQERGITQYDLYTKYNMNRAQLHRLRHNLKTTTILFNTSDKILRTFYLLHFLLDTMFDTLFDTLFFFNKK